MDPDRLAAATGAEAAYYAHDAYGNRIYAGSTAYTGTPNRVYNDQNRLVSVIPAVGAPHDSVYDAFGRRIAGHGMVFVYDQAGRVPEASLRDGSSSFFGDLVWVEGELLGRVEDDVSVGIDLSAWVPPAVHRWMPGPGQRWIVLLGAGGTLLLFSLAVRTRNPRWGTAGAALALVLVAGIACVPTGVAFYWVVTDHLGTPIAMTNTPTSGEAKVIWKASYEPFGRAVEDLDPDSDSTSVRMPVRFPGQWWDYNTKDHYNFLRDYDPKTGRYLEADPVGQAGGFNLYRYSGASPVNFADPLGLFRMSPGFRAVYPRTAAVVDSARESLNDEIYESFKENGFGASKSVINDIYTPGKGPWVGAGLTRARDGVGWANGTYHPEVGIQLNANYAQALEDCLSGKARALIAAWLRQQLSHEVVHHLEYKAGKLESKGSTSDTNAIDFEIDAYGVGRVGWKPKLPIAECLCEEP